MSTQPDQNAPNRPPSAYVRFSNRGQQWNLCIDRPMLTFFPETRDLLKGQGLSFTEIAKTVGERWQVLPLGEKAIYESRAQIMKHQYHTQLAEYKKTKDHANYQEYLADFQVKHDHQLSSKTSSVDID